jgi:hypothetical protein
MAKYPHPPSFKANFNEIVNVCFLLMPTMLLHLLPFILPFVYLKLVSPWINILNHGNCQQLWSLLFVFEKTWVDKL